MKPTIDWSELDAAVKAMNRAYMDWLAAKAEEREGSKAYRRAEDAWLDAVSRRADALEQHWTPDDGVDGFGRPLYGPVLRRYYADRFATREEVKRR